MAKSLYICYFGVREPLVQTQVIPYLRELARHGHQISLLTFDARIETKNRLRDEQIRRQLAEDRIEWHSRRYHKRFSVLATAWDVFRGVVFVRQFIARNRPDILHGRVHVPTLMAALGRSLSRHKPRLLFDIRGFMPEEYTDAGIWPENGWLYRLTKRVESWLLKKADGFVVLTERARQILFPESCESGYDKYGRPVEVIPCCVDLSRFSLTNGASRTKIREKLGLDSRFVMAYVGAFGGWYLTEETADLFGELKKLRPDAFALVLTQSKREVIEPLLRKRGYGSKDYIIKEVPPSKLPEYLNAADAAVSFIKSCYSKQASSPTKNAEYLACGLPIIANAGIGDVDKLVGSRLAGALVHEFSPKSYRIAIEELDALGKDRNRLREIARNEFDLITIGFARYKRIYHRLADK
jgi:glycosyltransferase involved in cell wall biosynthesis